MPKDCMPERDYAKWLYAWKGLCQMTVCQMTVCQMTVCLEGIMPNGGMPERDYAKWLYAKWLHAKWLYAYLLDSQIFFHKVCNLRLNLDVFHELVEYEFLVPLH